MSPEALDITPPHATATDRHAHCIRQQRESHVTISALRRWTSPSTPRYHMNRGLSSAWYNLMIAATMVGAESLVIDNIFRSGPNGSRIIAFCSSPTTFQRMPSILNMLHSPMQPRTNSSTAHSITQRFTIKRATPPRPRRTRCPNVQTTRWFKSATNVSLKCPRTRGTIQTRMGAGIRVDRSGSARRQPVAETG